MSHHVPLLFVRRHTIHEVVEEEDDLQIEYNNRARGVLAIVPHCPYVGHETKIVFFTSEGASAFIPFTNDTTNVSEAFPTCICNLPFATISLFVWDVTNCCCLHIASPLIRNRYPLNRRSACIVQPSSKNKSGEKTDSYKLKCGGDGYSSRPENNHDSPHKAASKDVRQLVQKQGLGSFGARPP